MTRQNQPDVSPIENWPVYVDPLHRYSLHYPRNWTVHADGPDRTRLRAPGAFAEFSIEYCGEPSSTRTAALRQRRLNYYLTREFTRFIAKLEVAAFEFMDTVSGMKDFRAVLPAENGCLELAWRFSERAEGQACQSTLEAILSTFEFTPGPSNRAGNRTSNE